MKIVETYDEMLIPTASPISLRSGLTIEHALYGIIVLVALVLRLFALGVQPLNPLEAANAWPAWLAAMAVDAPPLAAPTSPLLYSLHTLLFWLTQGNDAIARLAPALAGCGLVLLAWWWRQWLSRSAALVLALLFAVDPWLVAYSRLADGAALALFCGTLALTGFIQLLALPVELPIRTRWAYLTALAVGLLVVSGALAWSYLPVLLWFWLLFGRTTPLAADEEAEPAKLIGSLTLPRTAWLLGIAAALLGATGWLARLGGLGLISRSLSAWILLVTGDPAVPYPLSWPFLRLWVDTPLTLLFGLLGLTQLWLGRSPGADVTATMMEPLATRHSPLATHRPWRWFLSGWLLWGLVLILLPGRNPLSLPMLGVPLILLAAMAGGKIFRPFQRNLPWLESLLLLGVLSILLVFLTFSVWYLTAQGQLEFMRALVLLLFMALALLLILMFALWSDWPQTRFVVGCYVGALLLLVTVSNCWRLNQRLDPGERNGFFAQFTDPDVRRLALDVHTLSAQRVGDATQIAVLAQMTTQPDPVLGWYLRDLHNLSWVLAPKVQTAADQAKPLVITFDTPTADDQQLVDYMGSRYAVRGVWLPSALTKNVNIATDPAGGLSARLSSLWVGQLRTFLRWVLYREVKETAPTEKVILWVAHGS